MGVLRMKWLAALYSIIINTMGQAVDAVGTAGDTVH